MSGQTVALLADPTSVGKVLKAQGQRVRVDFSQSGGKKSAWVIAQDLMPGDGGDGGDSDEEPGSGRSDRSARGTSPPAPIALTERYEAKLNRNKLELEVMGIGLQTFNKVRLCSLSADCCSLLVTFLTGTQLRCGNGILAHFCSLFLTGTQLGAEMELQRGKPAEKYLYQNMTGWQATDKGFEISMASGEHCSFSCASGEKICEAMTEKASELAKVCDFSLTFLLTLLTLLCSISHVFAHFFAGPAASVRTQGLQRGRRGHRGQPAAARPREVPRVEGPRSVHVARQGGHAEHRRHRNYISNSALSVACDV